MRSSTEVQFGGRDKSRKVRSSGSRCDLLLQRQRLSGGVVESRTEDPYGRECRHCNSFFSILSHPNQDELAAGTYAIRTRLEKRSESVRCTLQPSFSAPSGCMPGRSQLCAAPFPGGWLFGDRGTEALSSVCFVRARWVSNLCQADHARHPPRMFPVPADLHASCLEKHAAKNPKSFSGHKTAIRNSAEASKVDKTEMSRARQAAITLVRTQTVLLVDIFGVTNFRLRDMSKFHNNTMLALAQVGAVECLDVCLLTSLDARCLET